jgi:hypothetical protein
MSFNSRVKLTLIYVSFGYKLSNQKVQQQAYKMRENCYNRRASASHTGDGIGPLTALLYIIFPFI